MIFSVVIVALVLGSTGLGCIEYTGNTGGVVDVPQHQSQQVNDRYDEGYNVGYADAYNEMIDKYNELVGKYDRDMRAMSDKYSRKLNQAINKRDDYWNQVIEQRDKEWNQTVYQTAEKAYQIGLNDAKQNTIRDIIDVGKVVAPLIGFL